MVLKSKPQQPPATISAKEQGEEEGKLSNQQRFCYGIGHIQNDLLTYAAFSYLLVFLTKVVGISSSSTGIIFLCGQVTNSILSPAVGFACDRYKLPILSRFGRRKAWHLLGVMILTISVPFLFLRCIPCGPVKEEWMLLFNYIAVTVSMNFGFTAVEISHLSLLPKIAVKATDFVKLNSIRTAWMFMSGIFVYGLMWILLGNSSGENLNHEQWREFMSLGFIITGIGLFFSATFHIGTKEPKKERIYGGHDNVGFQEESEDFDKPVPERIREKAQHELDVNKLTELYSSSPELRLKDYSEGRGAHWVFQPQDAIDGERGIRDSNMAQVAMEKKAKEANEGLDVARIASDPENGGIGTGIGTGIGAKKQKHNTNIWFRKPEFYLLCVIFMCTKVVINVSNSYFPLYLVDALQFPKEAIAYFPLIVLVASSVFSFLAKRINKKLGNKFSFCVAAAMVIGAFTWFYFQTIDSKSAVYGASILMGGGYSVMLVTMLTMVAEMINRVDKESGAFVYGAASLLDKMANGVLIAIIQEFYPKTNDAGVCTECGTYIRHVFPITTGAAAILGLVLVLAFYRTRTDPASRFIVEDLVEIDITASSSEASTSASTSASSSNTPSVSGFHMDNFYNTKL